VYEGLYPKNLRCDLTPAEVAARADEGARVQQEIEGVITDAKEAAEAYGKKRKSLELRRSVLMREVRERSTYRDVECVQRLNEETLMVEMCRTDTGEVYDQRPATEEEKQHTLPQADPPEFDPPPEGTEDGE
jgi:hypothetical protein